MPTAPSAWRCFRKVCEENMFGFLQANRIFQVSKRRQCLFGVSAHVDSMGFKVKTANWKTSLKGEAKAGAGGGCDPQNPHCAPDPRAVLRTRLWLWKHHSKQDKRHLFNPSPARERGALFCGKHYPGQLCREGGRCKVLESHYGGCRNRGQLPGRGQRGTKGSSAFLPAFGS